MSFTQYPEYRVSGVQSSHYTQLCASLMARMPFTNTATSRRATQAVFALGSPSLLRPRKPRAARSAGSLRAALASSWG